MMNDLNTVQWMAYSQPAGNTAITVPSALRALADGADLDRSYSQLLFAVGNDHAGTYRAVVLPALPFLGEILRGDALVARLRTLDVLIDLLGSFEPEFGCGEVDLPEGRGSLSELVKALAASFIPDLEHLHQHPGDDEESRLAAQLLALLRE